MAYRVVEGLLDGFDTTPISSPLNTAFPGVLPVEAKPYVMASVLFRFRYPARKAPAIRVVLYRLQKITSLAQPRKASLPPRQPVRFFPDDQPFAYGVHVAVRIDCIQQMNIGGPENIYRPW